MVVSRGEEVGKHEWIARKLTGGSIWAEGGRKEVVGMRGEAPARMAVAAGEGRADSAARRLTRAREGATWVRAEAAQLGARGIEAERRGVAGATPAAALLTLLGSTCPRARRKKKEDVREASRRVNG